MSPKKSMQYADNGYGATEIKDLKEGIKYDDGKPAWDLLPYDALEDVADVLTYGSTKYARRNWEKGMVWGRLLRASVGHLAKFMMGETYDKESGKHHLAHAACDTLFVLAYFKRKIGTDDRQGP